MKLARQYRPQKLSNILGQEALLADSAPLRKLIEANALPHAFFYGPPGCGKTTLARVIAKILGRPFHELNATTLKIDQLRKLVEGYKESLMKPLIFIDEVHRLSKNQQEVLLPYMEDDLALIIGASTQNPYYAMTAAMRSRSHLFKLEPIPDEVMHKQLGQIAKSENIILDEQAREYLVRSSTGDMRAMINLLESAAHIETTITESTLRSLRPHAVQAGSSEPDSHYDLASAMIKSVRGSDINAAMYYMARLIGGGEPPEFIARRLAILASEDIGNANPNALNLAASTLTIVKEIGYPEARIPLAQLLIYLASCPKSNSAYLAINRAEKTIREGAIHPVPDHIKTHSKTYRYPHDFGGWVAQEYCEKEFDFYLSGRIGFEKKLDEWLEAIKKSTRD